MRIGVRSIVDTYFLTLIKKGPFVIISVLFSIDLIIIYKILGLFEFFYTGKLVYV